MPDFARFLTRVREDLSRFRGSTDRLCAHRQMLHPLPRGQDAFMEAMREELAWHCLHFPSVAQLCWDAGCLPRKLLTYADLAHIPEYGEMPGGDEARERRRWDRVARNCLADLGWSRLRRAAYQEVPAELGSWGGRVVVGRCREGNWHWPRLVRVVQGRVFSPCLRGGSRLWVPAPAEAPQRECPCGRGSHYVARSCSHEVNKTFF
jgi:hypothetical protein